MRDVSRHFVLADVGFGRRCEVTKLGDATLECAQLLVPRVHLARGERQLDREAAAHQLGMSLRALALSGQRTDLALHLTDQIVDARQVERGLLESALGAATTVAIQTDARRFLEQLAPVIRAVGEQRVDGLRLDHDARVAARGPCRAAGRECREAGMAID